MAPAIDGRPLVPGDYFTAWTAQAGLGYSATGPFSRSDLWLFEIVRVNRVSLTVRVRGKGGGRVFRLSFERFAELAHPERATAETAARWENE